MFEIITNENGILNSISFIDFKGNMFGLERLAQTRDGSYYLIKVYPAEVQHVISYNSLLTNDEKDVRQTTAFPFMSMYSRLEVPIEELKDFKQRAIELFFWFVGDYYTEFALGFPDFERVDGQRKHSYAPLTAAVT